MIASQLPSTEKKLNMCRLLQLLTILIYVALSAKAFAQNEIQIEKHNGAIEVSIGDEPFTAYNFKETAKPFLYPVLGPRQIRMTRDFPMKKRKAKPTITLITSRCGSVTRSTESISGLVKRERKSSSKVSQRSI